MNGPGDPNQGGYPPQGQGYPPPHGQPPHGKPGQGGYPPHQPYPPGYPPQRSNNKALLITLIVLLVAAIAGGAILYFTGAFGGGNKAAANTSVAVAPVAVPAPVTPAPTTTSTPAPPGPSGSLTPDQVAERLEMGVAQFQPRLPLRNGPATITAVSSSGTVVTMVMEISQALSPSDWASLQPEFQRSLCAGPFSQAISAGASAQVEVTDTSGASRTYTIASC